MRRRQHDHDALPPQRRHRQKQKSLVDQDASRTNSKDWRRSWRLSYYAVIAAAAFGSAIFVVVFLGRRSPISSQRPPSVRGGDAGKKQQRRRRVIAVGDIHGDKEALVRALRLANVVDRRDDALWTGGSDVVVQIGDLLNKAEPRDAETLAYVADVERRARHAGGGVFVTVGDHDLHNAPRLWREMHSERSEPFPSWMAAAHVIDRTVFVHGSLSKVALENSGGSLESMVREAGEWLSGTGEKPAWIGRGDGPIWSRLYSDKASDEDNPQQRRRCDYLSALFSSLSVDRMVVGHTIRRDGISSSCDDRVWRIDVGLSRTETRAGKIGASEVLELSEGGTVVRILSTDIKLKSWER